MKTIIAITTALICAACGGASVTTDESRSRDKSQSLSGERSAAAASETPAYYEWSERIEGSAKLAVVASFGFERQSDGSSRSYDIVCGDSMTWVAQGAGLSLRLPQECTSAANLPKGVPSTGFAYTEGTVAFPTSTTATLVLAYKTFENGILKSTIRRTLSGVKVAPPSNDGPGTGGPPCDPKAPKGALESC